MRPDPNHTGPSRPLPHPPHAPAVSPGSPRLEPAFAFVAALRSPDADRLDLPDVLDVVLGWAREKFPEPVPEDAWYGAPFRIAIPGQVLHVVAPPCDPDRGEPDFWAMRLEQPDAPMGDHRPVPGRSWISEVSLLRLNGTVRLAMRVHCASQPYATAPVHLVRPRVLVDLADRFVLEQVRQLAYLVLGLGHGHAVAGHDDHITRDVQDRCDIGR